MTQTIVALYDTVPAASRAVRDLRDAGMAGTEISVMAADADGKYARNLPTLEPTATETGLGMGATLGGLAGVLAGLGALTIPGIGPVLAVGPLTAGLAALAGGAVGAMAGGAAGGLLGAMVDAGLPEDQASHYAEGVRRGGTLVAVRASADQVNEARAILERHNPVEMDERVDMWRREGWTRFDPHAGPYVAAAAMGSAAAMGGGAAMASSAAASGAVAAKTSGNVVATDYARYAPAFRGHYQTHLASSGFQYEHFEPAYQYGLTLGNYEPYRGLDWMQIEREARLAWEERNPNTWDRVRDAVRYGWERVRMPVR